MTNFRIGELDVCCVSDGILKSSVDFILGMEREDALPISGAEPDGTLPIPVNNFVFRRDGATMLIDAGAGNTMQPTLGRLPDELRKAGHAPEAITHVILTHLHSDHANGLVDDAGAPVFPNAELLVHTQEHEFWMRPNDGSESASVLRTRARNKINLAPYEKRIRLMRDGESLLGCSPMLAPGHSPGHTCWKVETGATAMLAWGDLVHFSTVQISHPRTAVRYDLDPDRARQSRLSFLEMAARDRLLIAGAHVAAPGLGHVSRTAGGYAFEPLSPVSA